MCDLSPTTFPRLDKGRLELLQAFAPTTRNAGQTMPFPQPSRSNARARLLVPSTHRHRPRPNDVVNRQHRPPLPLRRNTAVFSSCATAGPPAPPFIAIHPTKTSPPLFISPTETQRNPMLWGWLPAPSADTGRNGGWVVGMQGGYCGGSWHGCDAGVRKWRKKRVG